MNIPRKARTDFQEDCAIDLFNEVRASISYLGPVRCLAHH